MTPEGKLLISETHPHVELFLTIPLDLTVFVKSIEKYI